MAFDTFDTDSAIAANVTFTNSNLTAQGGSGSSLNGPDIAQSLEGKKSGKWYVEFTCVAVSGNIDGVGVINSWGTMGVGGGAGILGGNRGAAPSADNGWGYFTNSNVVFNNTAQTAVNNVTWTTADVIGIAIDLDNGRLWFRKNTGSWIGTSGTPDPATNTSGFNISHMLSGFCRVYPAVNLSGSSAKFTANFGASAFTGTVPSGFTSGWTNTTSGTYFGTFACSGRGNANGVSGPPQNNKAVSKYTSNFTGTLDHFIIPFAGATVVDMKGVVYDDTGVGGLPGALLGVSTNVVLTGNYGENRFNFSGVSLTSGSNYWFGIVSDGAVSSSQNTILCLPLTNGIAFNSGTYASPTNPFGAGPSTSNFRYPVMVFPTPSAPAAGSWMAVFGCANAGSNLATLGTASVTRTIGVGGTGMQGNFDLGTSDTFVSTRCRSAGSLDKFNVNVTANTRTTADTATSRLNGGDANMSASITGSTTGVFSDSTHSDALAVSDGFNAAFATGTGAGSTTVVGLTERFRAASGASTVWMSGNSGTGGTSSSNNMFTGSATRECSYAGGATTGGTIYSLTTALQTNVLARMPGTLSYLYTYVDTNSRGNATTVTHKDGGSSGNSTISIGTGLTGPFEDTVHTDTITAGTSTLNLELVNGSTNNSLCIPHMGATVTCTTAPKIDLFSAGTSVTSDINYINAATQYIAPLGYPGVDSTEADAQAVMPASTIVGNERFYVPANPSSGFTVNMRIAGADGTQTISVGSTATGGFEDTTHTDSVSAGQLFNHKKSSSNLNGVQINNIALTLNATSTSFSTSKMLFHAFP